MRVLIAARLSRKPAPGEDVEFPIEAQDKHARTWAVNEGHEVIDAAADYKSGTVAPWDRPKFRPWVTVPEKIDSYDAIVFIKTDRVSRGTDEDFSRIEAWAADHHKKLIIVGPDGGVQFPSRNDSDYWQWVSAKRQARTEWESIRTRSMSRQADLIAAGKLVGRVPFGYEVAGTKYDKSLVPSEIGQKYIPLIYEHVADGWSLLKVCQWLDVEGVKPNSAKGVHWSPKSVSEIIRNRVYIGERRSRKTGQTVLRVTPLVDKPLWIRAGKRLDNATVGRRGPAKFPPALLTGVLFCGNCGSPMYLNRPKKDNPWWVYYRCYGKLPQRKGCGTMVTMLFLDGEVDREMLDNHLPVLHRKFVSGDTSEAELADIQLQLVDLPNRGLSDDDEDAERARLRNLRKELQSSETIPDKWISVAVTHDGEEITNPLEWATRDDLVTYANEWDSADLAGKREILKTWRITFSWSEEKDPLISMGPADGSIEQ